MIGAKIRIWSKALDIKECENTLVGTRQKQELDAALNRQVLITYVSRGSSSKWPDKAGTT
jgi:hypothetical protein